MTCAYDKEMSIALDLFIAQERQALVRNQGALSQELVKHRAVPRWRAERCSYL